MLDGVQTHMHQRPLQLDLHPHASSNPYTCTDTLLHLHNSTSDILNTDTMPARAAAAPPLQLQVRLYPDLRTDALDLVNLRNHSFCVGADWSCTGSDMHYYELYVLYELFKDRGWLRTGFGKQTRPALCPGRTQHEAAHSLTPVDPSQT